MIADLLRKCPLFNEMYDDEIDSVLKKSKVGSFNPGDKVVRSGDIGTQIFVLLDGKVSVRKEVRGRSVQIQQLHTGDVFGEMVLIHHRERILDIVVDEPSYVVEIEMDQIMDVYRAKPQVFGVFMLNLSRLLIRRLKASNEIIIKLRETL